MMTHKELIENAMEYSGLDRKEATSLLIAVGGITERYIHAVEDIKGGANYSLVRNIYSQQIIRMH